MAKLKMDIYYAAEVADLCASLEKFDLSFRCIQAQGPAGGNPYVEFTGERESLANYAATFPDADYLINSIED